jgi:drug/metabolite transporter (DMT)-like permease
MGHGPAVADGRRANPAGRAWLRVAGAVLFLLAVVLGWLAFTRFDGGDAPSPGSPDYRSYEDRRIRQGQVSVVLGLGSAVSLALALACHDRAGRLDPPQP